MNVVSDIKNTLIKNLSNLPGWSSKRKIIVIESDDWGSVRMPSANAFTILNNKGIDLTSGDAKRYNLYDTLATPDDLTALFGTLTDFKDLYGHSAVFTAVSVVANPDFFKIRQNNFEEYYYEPFTETLKRYHGNDKSYQVWLEGIKNKIFMPQFHAREHLNISAWMRALQQKDHDTHVAFKQGVWGFNNKPLDDAAISYQAAFDLYNSGDLKVQENTIKEGLDLFEKLFGYKASFFVPTNGPFNNSLEKVAADCGIKYMSAAKIQVEPLGNGKTRKVFHYLGQQNKHKQHYITRNCFFEPSQEGKDWISSCLNDIEIAFRWNKPAVISSHRVNYIGAIDPKNRENGLKQLKIMLQTILKKWPDIEFMTSDQLGDLIVESKKVLLS